MLVESLFRVRCSAGPSSPSRGRLGQVGRSPGFGADADVVIASNWGLLFVPGVVDAARPLIVQCHGSIGQIPHRGGGDERCSNAPN